MKFKVTKEELQKHTSLSVHMFPDTITLEGEPVEEDPMCPFRHHRTESEGGTVVMDTHPQPIEEIDIEALELYRQYSAVDLIFAKKFNELIRAWNKQ